MKSNIYLIILLLSIILLCSCLSKLNNTRIIEKYKTETLKNGNNLYIDTRQTNHNYSFIIDRDDKNRPYKVTEYKYNDREIYIKFGDNLGKIKKVSVVTH